MLRCVTPGGGVHHVASARGASFGACASDDSTVCSVASFSDVAPIVSPACARNGPPTVTAPPPSLTFPAQMAGTFTDGKEGTSLGYAAVDAGGVLAPYRFTRCVCDGVMPRVARRAARGDWRDA
jgi:hypothetical protein